MKWFGWFASARLFLCSRDPLPFIPKWLFWIIGGTALCLGLLFCRIAQTRFDIRRHAALPNGAVLATAEAIGRLCRTRLLQVRLVEQAAESLVEYDVSTKVYGDDSVPTLEQILETRRTHHWLYPRGDCKARAVLAGSLLNALAIDWEPAANPFLKHAWIRVHVDGAWIAILFQDRPNPASRWYGSLAFVSEVFGYDLPTVAIDQYVPLWVPDLHAPAAAMRDQASVGAFFLSGTQFAYHASIDFAHPASTERVGEIRDGACRVAGFPLGEPR
jgi:hypothetical protein